MAKEHNSLVLTWKNETEAAKKCESLQELKEKQVNDMYDKKMMNCMICTSQPWPLTIFSLKDHMRSAKICLNLHQLLALLLLKWPFLLQQRNQNYSQDIGELDNLLP